MYILRASQYSRSDSVKYALKYALNPNKKYRYFPLIKNNSGNCANFVSQCLYAGGAPMILSPKNPWWYNKYQPVSFLDFSSFSLLVFKNKCRIQSIWL